MAVVVNDGSDNSDVAMSSVTVLAENDAPVVDLNGGAAGEDFEASFTEGGGPVAIVDAVELEVNDPDDTSLASATVTITNLLDGADELLAVDTGATNITSDYSPSTGILTLSGEDSLANYEQVLRTLSYDNSASLPSTTARTIEVVVNDGTDDSTVRTATVTVVGVNNPPNLAPIADRTGFVEEELVIAVMATDLDSGDTLTFDLDPDNSPSLATISKTGDTTAEIRWTPTAADQGNSVTFVVLVNDNGTPVRVDSETFQVTVSAPRPVVDLNGSNDPGIDFSATFTEDDGPVAIVESDVSIQQPRPFTLIQSVTATITNLADGAAEILSVDSLLASGITAPGVTPDITASYENGVLTLTGDGLEDDYAEVLARLTYDNISEDPTPGDRTVEVVVNDGDADSLPATATVTVNAVNDLPNLVIDTDVFDSGPLPVEQGTQILGFNTSVTDLDHGPSELVYLVDSDDSGLPDGVVPPVVTQSDEVNPGFVSWTPAEVGTFTFRLLVIDAEGGVDQEEFAYQVTAAVPPTVTSAPTGTLAGPIMSLTVVFSEAMRSQAFNAGNYSVTKVGGGSGGTVVPIAEVTTTTFTSAVVSFATNLDPAPTA